jgi:hypothetical protein
MSSQPQPQSSQIQSARLQTARLSSSISDRWLRYSCSRRNPLYPPSSRRPHLLPPQLAPPATPTASQLAPQPAAPSSASRALRPSPHSLSRKIRLHRSPQIYLHFQPTSQLSAPMQRMSLQLSQLQPASPPAEDKRARKPSQKIHRLCRVHALRTADCAGTDCSAAFAPVQCPSTEPDGAWGTGTVYRPQEVSTPHPDERVAKAVAVAVGECSPVPKRCQGVHSLTRAGASRGACLLKRPSLHMTTSKTSDSFQNGA